MTGAQILSGNWSYCEESAKTLGSNLTRSFSIAQCDDCQFIFSVRLPDAAFLELLYDRVIDGQLARQHNLSLNGVVSKMETLATLLTLANQKGRPCRVLDFGCGFGPTLQLLCAIPDVQALGFETSLGRAMDLRGRGLPVTQSIDEVQRQGPFDALILDNVLEHVPTPRDLVVNLRGLLNAGGFVYVSVPAASADDFRAHRKAAESGQPLPMDINPWEHLNYFDLTHLDGLMNGANLTPLKASELPRPVNVGLRASHQFFERAKNAIASSFRMMGYVANADAMANVTARFYKCGPSTGT
jgi:SAM-dependent methyltransferase